MLNPDPTSLRREAALVQQFAGTYRTRLAATIDALNRSLTTVNRPGADRQTAMQSVRCCVEAVDMVLASHEQFARSLQAMADEATARPALRRAA